MPARKPMARTGRSLGRLAGVRLKEERSASLSASLRVLFVRYCSSCRSLAVSELELSVLRFEVSKHQSKLLSRCSGPAVLRLPTLSTAADLFSGWIAPAGRDLLKGLSRWDIAIHLAHSPAQFGRSRTRIVVALTGGGPDHPARHVAVKTFAVGGLE